MHINVSCPVAKVREAAGLSTACAIHYPQRLDPCYLETSALSSSIIPMLSTNVIFTQENHTAPRFHDTTQVINVTRIYLLASSLFPLCWSQLAYKVYKGAQDLAFSPSMEI